MGFTEGEEKILSVLKLSFDELKPPSLKQCFAYCSMFSKDFDLEKDDLIQLWMARGWLQGCSDDRILEMEERGDEYFKILLAKSFFQDVTRDYGGNVTTCKMHDLVHDLAAHVSKSGNLRSLFSDGELDLEVLRCCPIFFTSSNLRNFKSLRVLNLYKADIEVLPDFLEELRHLRYLNVLKTKLKALPKSVGKLYNLQTLKVPYHIKELPKEIENLINLRHIYFGRYMKVPAGILRKMNDLRSLPFLKVGDETCPGIEELSGLNQLHDTLKIYGLENIRDGKEAEQARLVEKKHICKLILGWKLTTPSHNEGNDDEDPSHNGGNDDPSHNEGNDDEDPSHNGGNDDEDPSQNDDDDPSHNGGNDDDDPSHNGGNDDEDPSQNDDDDPSHNGGNDDDDPSHNGGNDDDDPSHNRENDDAVLEGLRPHSSLKFLEIHGFMGVKFPSWLLLANNLKEIELLGCNNCEGVPVLGHLPNLSCVKIEKMEKLSCIGPEFYGNTHIKCGNRSSNDAQALFPALKSLHIVEARNLIEWMEAPTERASVVFPCLEELTLFHCDHLTSAPSHFPSLKKLVIWNMKRGGMPIASILSNQLTTLTYLELGEVGEITCLPGGTLENNKNLAHLELGSCTELTCVSPQSQGFESSCASLSYLGIYYCDNLRYLPDGILTPSLKVLKLWHCQNLEYIPVATHGGLPSLGELMLDECPRLSSLPGGLEDCTSIRSLTITRCPELPSISIGSLTTSLQELSVSNLDNLPISRGGFTSLRQLTIRFSESAQFGPEFSGFLQTLVSLQTLKIWGCDNLETIPSPGKLTSLRSLEISSCRKLKCLPDWLATSSQSCSLTRLKELRIGPFNHNLDAFPAFQAIPQLESLFIHGWRKLKSLPDQIQHLPSLKHLCIESFYDVEAFPEWLGNLASLEELSIEFCYSLKDLPSVEAMHGLTKFCYSLKDLPPRIEELRSIRVCNWRLICLTT